MFVHPAILLLAPQLREKYRFLSSTYTMARNEKKKVIP